MNIVVRVAGFQLCNLSEFDTISVVSVNNQAAMLTAITPRFPNEPQAFAFFLGDKANEQAMEAIEAIWQTIQEGLAWVDLSSMTQPATEDTVRACGIKPKKESGGDDEEGE